VYKQQQIDFDQAAGEALAKAGMELAVETAEAEFRGWKDRCWQLFYQWLNKKPRYHEFLLEDFREYCYQYDLIEKPRSERAFAFLSKKASKLELIMCVGDAKTRNKTAHRAKASKWVKK
jgi:hypothetical protein